MAHRPQRTCLGCGGRDDQDQLMRMIVAHGRLVLEDRSGRGGYLHPSAECRRRFIEKNGQYRAFRAEISKAIKEQFIAALESRERE